MNWLLINPTQHFINMFPLGVAYVSSALKAAGINVQTLDLAFVCDSCEETRGALSRAMQNDPIDIIGIGGLYAERHRIAQIIAWCREANPRALIVIGNGVVSCDPVLMLPALGGDLAVIGEGEETAVALHRALESGSDLKEVQGIAFRDKDGSVVVTHPRMTHMDLDHIPIPDYEGFQVERYISSRPESVYYGFSFMDNYRGLPILASRSCPLSCTFCYHTIGTYRRRSMEGFFNEVQFLVERYDVNSLQIYDDLFAVKRERVVEFSEGIKKFNLLWQVSLRVQNVKPGMIDLPVLTQMRDAGCRAIGLGLESASADVLASMKKKISVDQITTALDLITRANINFQGNFIFGDRAETPDTANETLDWWRRHRHYAIQVDPIWVFPGTELYTQGIADGRIPDAKSFLALQSPVLNLSRMDDDTFDQMCDVLDIFGRYLNRIPAQLLRIEKSAVINGRQCYSSTSLCPHCGEVASYKDHAYFRRFLCRQCGGMFDIPIARMLGRAALSEESTLDLERAVAALAAGDHGVAFVLAKNRHDENEQDWGAAGIMGAAMLRYGFVEAAQVFLRKSLDLNSDNGETCNNLGVCLYAMNSVAVALLMFRQAIQLEASIPEAVANEKMALAHLGGDDRILDFVHSPNRPKLSIEGLQIAVPTVERTGGNTAAHPPTRQSNDHLRHLVQAWMSYSLPAAS